MNTTQPPTVVVMHQPAEWLDYFHGKCRTKCGLELDYGTPSQRRCLTNAVTRDCVLCEAADIIDSVPVRYSPGTLF